LTLFDQYNKKSQKYCPKDMSSEHKDNNAEPGHYAVTVVCTGTVIGVADIASTAF
jgi:hypothetical protein